MSKPKIGLALGSGSARGLAHIGVLRALEENNINIDFFSGSSAGALIGGLYCTGISPKMLKGLAIQVDKKTWLDFTVPNKGIVKGDRIEEILKIITGSRNIEDLDKKISIVSTNLNNAEEVVFTSGPLYKAIRASISIPGVFEPVKFHNEVLVDGGVVDRLPVSVLKDMGADIIIASDVGFGSYQSRIFRIFDIIQQSIDIMSKRIYEEDKRLADIIIQIPLSHIDSFSFERVEECEEIGYNTTIKAISQIKEKINEVSNL
ncbi:patatin family protein [Acidilutibacter cellobiosedens]|jgi:NTE family protein|uniref:Patatin family protein n=1 Tax=Acidilutibacter cellobiosedens TaxID=2507161 RepID=A0A410QCC5_9FIRM|nr:patatin-like phospholipase family protein [Acidilutibacter cellobiosedens]QAT61569.1 patatin family protein [Acidilutibacter cellobiosedens]